jgi:hypothetical protein
MLLTAAAQNPRTAASTSASSDRRFIGPQANPRPPAQPKRHSEHRGRDHTVIRGAEDPGHGRGVARRWILSHGDEFPRLRVVAPPLRLPQEPPPSASEAPEHEPEPRWRCRREFRVAARVGKDATKLAPADGRRGRQAQLLKGPRPGTPRS